MKIRPMLEGLGAALLLFPSYMEFLIPSNLPLYHHGLPVTNLIGGVLVDLLCITILATCFLFAIQYLSTASQGIVRALFAGIMLWRIVDVAFKYWIATTTLNNSRYAFWWGAERIRSCVVILLLAVTLGYFLPRIAQPAERAVRLLVAAFAFSALWTVPHLIHLALLRQPEGFVAFNHLTASAHSEPNKRIVWILFDELSYDQIFDHSFTGMELPNFNRLRTQSVSFSNLSPVGFYTDRIIPSIFMGRRIDQIRGTLDGRLLYKDGSQNRWLAYDPSATFFALAQQNGWTTGVDDWFNPACQLLASTLDVCFSEFSDSQILTTEEYGASEEKSVLVNAAAPWNEFIAKLTNRRTQQPANAHVIAYRNVMTHAYTLIENDQVGFLYVHLPIPHPPGIYDRQRHILRPGGNYLDNMVLADDTLGTLLQQIDTSPSASRTTVIVSSDHSWRVPLWKSDESWTAEEGRASRGRFDERPVLLIHFPGQTSGHDVASAQPELLEHDIISDMLLGKMNTPEDLEAFVAKHSQ